MTPLAAAALIGAGFAIGVYATAIGAGGGFLITPLLLFLYSDVEPELVTSASLVVVAINAATASVLASRERRIDYPLVGAMAAVAVPGALLGAAATAVLPRDVFALGFAALLLALAAYLSWRPRAGIAAPVRRSWRRELRDREGNHFAYRVPVLRSVLPNAGTAFLGALAGIGGGPIGVPVLTRVMRVPHAIAVPSMQLLIAVQSLAAVALHIAAGNLGEPMEAVPWLGAGVVAASPVAQRVRRRLGEGALMRALSVGLAIVAVRTAWGVVA